MKVVSKLTARYLRKNKVRTLLTLIGIIIAIATFASIGNSIVSVLEIFREDYIRTEGTYDFRIENSNQKIDAKINDIKDVYSTYRLRKQNVARTVLKDDDLDLNYFLGLNIIEAKDSFFEEFTSKKFLVEGRLPQNDTEILVPYDMKYIGLGFEKLGNMISVGVSRSLEGDFSYSNPFSINYLRQLSGDSLLTEDEYQETIYYFSELQYNKENLKDFRDERLEENLKNFYISEENLRNLVDTFDENKTYTIVGYHYGDSENITNNHEFIPTKLHESGWKEAEVYAQNSKNLILSGEIFTVNNEINDNYNLYGIFSNYDNLNENKDIINNLLKENGRDNYNVFNEGYIGLKNIFNNNIGSFVYSFLGILGLIILISIVIFVYNIFTSNYVERIRDLGLLKVVGFTNKQLFRMIMLDSFIYFIISVPIGYFLGNIAMKVVFNYVNKSIVEVSVISPYTLKVSTGYIIPLICAIFGFLIIFISNIFSALFVFRNQPAEAIKANNYVKPKYKVRKRNLIKKFFSYDAFIAYRNIDRNRKRFVMTMLSIAMSISLFTVVSSLTAYVESDFTKTIDKKEKEYGSVSTNEEYAMKLKEELTKIDGINVNTKQNVHSINLVKKDNITKEVLDEGYLVADVQVVTMSDIDFEDRYGDRDEIYFASRDTSYNLGERYDLTFVILDKKRPDYGEGIYGSIKEGKDITMNVVNQAFTELESFGVYGYNDILFMSESNYDKLIENYDVDELESKTRLLIQRNDYDYKVGYDLNAILKKYPTTNIILKTTPILGVIKLFVYGFIFLIMSIGALNIMNATYTNIFTRREELALLSTVGIENRRLKKIILYEKLLSTVLAIIISFIISIIFTLWLYGITLGEYRQIFNISFISEYNLPIRNWAIASLFTICLIYIFVTIPYNKMMNDNITDVLK